MKRIITVLTICLFFAASCDKGHVVHNDNKFDIECASEYFHNDTLDLPSDGGAALVNVLTSETAVAWGIRTALDKYWCDIVKYPNSFTIQVPANETASRETQVTVVVGENTRTIKVLQDFKRVLECDTDTLSVLVYAADYSVDYRSNIDETLISATCEESWVTSLTVTGRKVNFSVDANTAGQERTAKIKVTSGELSFEIVVVQEREPQANVLPDAVVNPVVVL